MFEIYDSDTEEPRLDMSVFFARRRQHSKKNKTKKIDIDKFDEFSSSVQKIYWDNLKTSIETAIKKLNPGNIRCTSIKLMKLNIMRGKGLLCRSIMEAQSHSPHFTHIYATLISFINHYFPNVAELFLVRCICLLNDAYKFKEEQKYVQPVLFIAHLVQNNVAGDCLILDILQILVKTPNSHLIGLVDKIMKVCGNKLILNPHNGLDLKYTFDELQNISKDEHIDESVQCLARTILLTYRKHLEDEQFDLVDPHEQYTHYLILDQNYNPEYELDNFEYDLDFKSTEMMYKTNTRGILKLKRKPYYFANYDFDEMADDEDDCEIVTDMLSFRKNFAAQKIISMLVNLDLSPHEIALEFMKIKMKLGREMVLCVEYMECCFENCAVYNASYADILQCYSKLNPLIVDSLEYIFVRVAPVVHQGSPTNLINLAKVYAYLLSTNSISWTVFSAVHLTDSETTYSGRTYFKTMFDELVFLMGREALKERILNPALRRSFAGLFPFDNQYSYVLCIKFFMDIDLYEVIDLYRKSLLQDARV